MLARDLGTKGYGRFAFAVAAALGLVAWNVTVVRRVGVNPTALPRRWYAAASARGGVGGAPSG